MGAGLLVALTPGLAFNLRLLPIWQLGVVAVIAAGLWAILRQAWRQQPEARIVAVGAILCSAAYLNDMWVDRGLLVGPRLIPFGFALFIFSLVVSLANRFQRIHLELEELDRLYSLSLDLLCVAGADGFFRRVNPAFTRTLGYNTAGEMLERPIFDFVHPEDQPATRERIDRLGRGEPV